MQKLPISACIVTFNEEERIADCLKSIDWCDEIVVVDSLSTDGTVQICEKFTDKVFQIQWQGYVKQKNYGIDQSTNEWVLCIDSDERISEKLKEEIKDEFEKGSFSRFDGFYFPRHVFYLGKWINHCGWYPDYSLRLFRKEKGRFGGIDPHDKVHLEGRTKKLKNDLYHFPYKNVESQIQHIQKYSDLYAKITPAKTSNYLNLLIKPSYKFFEVYILKRGFLDGIQGFIISVLTSYYMFLKLAKLYEKRLIKSQD